jgi:hypothetical protein
MVRPIALGLRCGPSVRRFGSAKLISGYDLTTPFRHADLDLQWRQIRSPAQALGNGDRQIRQCLVFCCMWRSNAGSVGSGTAAHCSSHVLSRPGVAFTSSISLCKLFLAIEPYNSSAIGTVPEAKTAFPPATEDPTRGKTLTIYGVPLARAAKLSASCAPYMGVPGRIIKQDGS